MPLTPSTPPGSPALPQALGKHELSAPPTGRLATIRAQIQRAYAEPLDRPGFIAAATYAASAISGALALAVTNTSVLSDPLMRQIIPFWYHYGSKWLWALPIIFGFSSKQFLPRAMAAISVVTMALWGAWSLLPFSLGPSLSVRLLYLGGALLFALPPLLRRLWNDSDST